MRIIFFEKPGCIGNSRQKAMLLVAGHQVEAHSLLTHPWSREELLSYFGSQPVAEWFNRSAPRVKSGEVRPDELESEAALTLMLNEPLLIRRPLMELNGQRCVGFDLDFVESIAGPLPREERLDAMRAQDLEKCPGEQTGYRCPDAKAASAEESSDDRSIERARSHPDQT